MSIIDTEGRCALPRLAILRAQGPDASAFLHGQLSNAVQGLPADSARPAGYCTAQGRLLANGVFWLAAPEHIEFMVAANLADDLLQRLRRFVLRAKVTLGVDASRQVSAAWGAAALPAALHSLAAWTRVDLDGDTWVMAPHTRAATPAAWRIHAAQPAADGSAEPRAANAADDLSTAPLAAVWAATRIASGWPLIQAETQDCFLPNALNLDLNGSIDFKKGCYPGQEVVARSHYRGTVKRRMACGTAPWPADAPAPSAASDLFAADDVSGRPVGRIIEASAVQGCLQLAAEISLADWPVVQYAVGSPTGPRLTLQAPPGAEYA
ncbi:CAF17-like 4Fe-4S cluster assembly/insertion protein YgfZ [Castellaniella caeni]|uniref:CAF17-like 4Fe-4S cluster assembly/insertion protein YgfZ n=1 Tax=Castellaniella caeni TaxID=266123 RepID=UPI0008295B85|nr:folate-binding protein YgfZ [Castellaniella caeni]